MKRSVKKQKKKFSYTLIFFLFYESFFRILFNQLTFHCSQPLTKIAKQISSIWDIFVIFLCAFFFIFFLLTHYFLCFWVFVSLSNILCILFLVLSGKRQHGGTGDIDIQVSHKSKNVSIKFSCQQYQTHIILDFSSRKIHNIYCTFLKVCSRKKLEFLFGA